MTARVLQALEALDRHSFDRVDSSNTLDVLQSKIFPAVSGSKSGEPLTVEQVTQLAKQDEPLVKLLCQWAVSDQRYGEHRALAAALLLEKRQADLVAAVEGDGPAGADENETEENSSPAGAASSSTGIATTTATVPQPVYQSFLIKFLDTEAPTLTETSAVHGNRTPVVFASLVHLFYELVKHDVFSHDAYMCSLISRGDLLSVTSANGSAATGAASTGPVQLGGGPPPNTSVSTMGGFQMGGMHDLRSEMDDSKIDDDLDKLLQHIKEEQQINVMVNVLSKPNLFPFAS